MNQILFINSSPRGDASHSSAVAKQLIAQLKAKDPKSTVINRDLTVNPLPHIGDDFVVGSRIEADKRNAAQNEAVAVSDKLVAELVKAETVVIASPMFNFGPTTNLKGWFDQILRAGVTFKYTDTGPVGLLSAKKVFVIMARGGVYSQGPMKAIDFQEPYLRHLLGFMGLTDVSFIPVEGIAYGPEAAEKSVAAAINSIPALLEAA